MESESLEIECPVCDQKMPADARKCPSCGVELATAGMAELEEVARDILEGKPGVAPTETEVPQSDLARQASDDPSPAPMMAGDVPKETAASNDNGTKEKWGLRRLFGRKKR